MFDIGALAHKSIILHFGFSGNWALRPARTERLYERIRSFDRRGKLWYTVIS